MSGVLRGLGHANARGLGHGYFTPPVTPDPSFSNVRALLHFNGADGSTTYTDVTGRTWTNEASAQIDTAQSKFGGSSLYLPASGDSHIRTAPAAALDPGTGTFAVEFWYRGAAGANAQQYRTLFSNYQNASTGMSFQLLFGVPILNLTGDGTDVTGVGVLAEETWYFIQVIRDGAGLVTIGINGVSNASATNAVSISSAGRFAIGRLGELATGYMFGWIDDFRYTVGATRTLSLPTAPFPDS